MSDWVVTYTQDWVIPSSLILAEYGAEWQYAESEGKTEDEFVKETLLILGADQIEDLIQGDNQWDVYKV